MWLILIPLLLGLGGRSSTAGLSLLFLELQISFSSFLLDMTPRKAPLWSGDLSGLGNQPALVRCQALPLSSSVTWYKLLYFCNC